MVTHHKSSLIITIHKLSLSLLDGPRGSSIFTHIIVQVVTGFKGGYKTVMPSAIVIYRHFWLAIQHSLGCRHHTGGCWHCFPMELGLLWLDSTIAKIHGVVVTWQYYFCSLGWYKYPKSWGYIIVNHDFMGLHNPWIECDLTVLFTILW